jgi:hypothetical protein
MKLLSFAKKWLDPYSTFAHRFLVSFRLMIRFYSVDVFLKEGTKNVATTFTASAFRLHWTSITDSRIGTVDENLLAFTPGIKWQNLTLWANILVLLSVILKVTGWILRSALAKVWDR